MLAVFGVDSCYTKYALAIPYAVMIAFDLFLLVVDYAYKSSKKHVNVSFKRNNDR